MGMYTGFWCDLKLKKDVSNDVIETIKYLAKMNSTFHDIEGVREKYPNEEFFRCENPCILNANYVGLGSEIINSYDTFAMPYTKFLYDESSKQWRLNCISNFKNDYNNIYNFFKMS